MKPWRAVIAVGCAMSLSSCAVLERPTASWPWDNYPCSLSPKADKETACASDEARALAMYIEASKFCRAVHNRYEAGANQAGLAQSAVSVLGTAAGIVAVSTTGTASKAFAAMSGSTNAMQLAMSNALSATAELKRQAAVGSAASERGKEVIDPTKTAQERFFLAVDMTNQCWLASAKAEQQILQAVSAPAPPPLPPPSAAALAAQAAQASAQAAAQATQAAESAKAAETAEIAKATEAAKRADAAITGVTTEPAKPLSASPKK